MIVSAKACGLRLVLSHAQQDEGRLDAAFEE